MTSTPLQQNLDGLASPVDTPPLPVELSFVVPLHNEEQNVAPLMEAIEKAAIAINRSYEIVAVDDGSQDATWQELLKASRVYSKLRPVALARCFGQSAAIKAGFDASRGRYIITLDGDLQNHPMDAVTLLQKLEAEDLDLVSGWRVDRQDATWSRNFPSWVANRIIAKSTGVKLHDIGCGLKVYRSELARSLGLYGELHRFLPIMAALSGGKVAEQAVSHHPRRMGQSKYGLARTFKVLLDLATVLFLHRFIARPLHFFGRAAMVWFALAGVVVLGLLTNLIFHVGGVIAELPLMAWTGFILLAIVTAWLSFALGLVAEIVSRTYFEAQRRPAYQIKATAA